MSALQQNVKSDLHQNAREILETAANLVCGDREKQHGNMRSNLQNIADLWEAYFMARGSSENLSAHDVASMMELLKIARRLTGGNNLDDYIDAAGYAAIAGALR